MPKKKEAFVSPFVPEEEQPYSIPENWCWAYLTGFAECLDSLRKPINATERAGRSGSIPYYGATGQVGWIDDFLTDEQLVLVGEDGAPFLDRIKDKAYMIEGKAWVNNHAHILRSYFGSAGNFYLLNYLNCFDYSGYVNGTTRLKLTQASMNTIPVPVPPFSEQHRIVSRIESLFAKLDEAKKKVQSVVDEFELRKSAILHKAFTGELTERWRKEHGKSNSDWRSVRFDEAAEIMGNLVDPTDYQDFPHIAPDNIEKRTGVLLEYHTIAEDGVKSGKHLFHAGQILYSKIRPYLSKVVIVDFDGLCSADMYPIDVKENTRYLWYYMLSDEFLEQASTAGSRSVLPKINQKELSKVMVRMTSLEEQQAIVIILDSIFEKGQQAKESAEAVLAQIDNMKKAILARAFRGELGTNDPEEESAANFLSPIL